jgi:YD repeat-containing protein
VTSQANSPSATWGSAGSLGVSGLVPADAQGLSAAASGPVQALQTDPTGHASQLILDGAGRPVREIRADGSTASWVRDPVTGYVLSQTDFLGRTTTFQRDALGYVTSEAPPAAVWTWWNAPMFFLAALLALTTEWVLRKQKNLV